MSLTQSKIPSLKDKLAAQEKDIKADLAELAAVVKAKGRAAKAKPKKRD